jgi:nucleoside-diphosphate-sugar epimerase
MSRVLITGSSGFVGSALCRSLAASGLCVRAAVREQRRAPVGCSEITIIEKVDGATRWWRALEGVDLVVHLAAKAHVTRGALRTTEYLEVNSNGTRALAAASALAGVRRFIYLSSIKVNGSSTAGRPFRAEDEVRPDGVYGYSKWLGERYVTEASAGSRMEAVIVRPPLVYGPGVKANFLALLKWVDRGWPLPFGSVENARSLVSIWNLMDLIAVLLRCPRSAAGTWMVSDGNDLSTPELVELIGDAMKRPARLLRVPTGALRVIGSILRIGGGVERLCGSLAVDMSATKAAFNWNPPLTVQEAICRTVDAYMRGREQ